MTQDFHEFTLLFGAWIQRFTKGTFPFKASRAALGRAATKSPMRSSACAVGESGSAGLKRSLRLPAAQPPSRLQLLQCREQAVVPACSRISPTQPPGADPAQPAPSLFPSKGPQRSLVASAGSGENLFAPCCLGPGLCLGPM